jgi:hypothetical protein
MLHALDSEVPPLKVRCSPMQCRVKKFAEGPEDPEVLLDTEGLEAHGLVHLLESKAAALG